MSRRPIDLKYKDFPIEKRQLIRAILNHGGNIPNFAKALGINQNIVHVWLNQNFIAPPAQYCRKIEQLTCGEVTCEQLRPDVFGPSLIVEETIEDKFKRAIGMMIELEKHFIIKTSKKPKKRG